MSLKGHAGFIRLFLLSAIVIFCKVNSYPFSYSGQEKNAVNLQTLCVSDFGNEIDQAANVKWIAHFSKFAKPADLSQENSPPDTNACHWEYVEAKPLGLPQNVDAKQKWSLGVKAQFLVKGYNWIEVIPVKGSAGNAVTSTTPAATTAGGSQSNVQPSTPAVKPETVAEGENYPIPLPGQIRSMDIWVWGGNYHYWMEFYVLDYKGFLNRLRAGDIDFVGWKNLMIQIPDNIPQAEMHVPFLKSLSLQMIKLWSYPTERVDQFYCYFSYLQVQTDVYIERFNGDDLANKRW